MRNAITLMTVVLLAVSACGDDAPEAGTEGGACLPGGTCQAGLLCVNEVCVDDGVPVADAGADAAPLVPDASPDSPTCTITAPLGGTTVAYDDTVTFVATASDPQDGPLTGASVVWRTDLAVPPLGSGLSIDTVLPVPGVHTVTCTATDAQGNTGSGSVVITSASPIATLNHPGDGETRSATADIPFVGLGRDFEDGSLTGASLVWTSSLDGPFGTGGSFNAMLSAGTNVVTLTVTDADGNTGTESITLTITP